MADRLPEVCVVTHPLAAAGENATRSLLDVLGAITTVALITADLPADSEIRGNYEVHEVSSASVGDSIFIAAGRFLANQLRMSIVIHRRPEDVVLFFGATAYLMPILVARLAGKTVILEPRGDVPLTLRLEWEQRVPGPFARALAGIVRGLERTGFRLAHAVVTYTPGVAKQLGLDPDAPNVHPTGARYVRTETFRVIQPYEDREPIVGFLGRLDEEKGIRELAVAVKRLPAGLHFRFIGDGALRSWLESDLGEEIRSGRVEVTGWVNHDDVPHHLNELKLLVLPSQPTEGLPTTVLEALACGTPVYASPVSGVPDVVRHGETGFHIESRAPADLVRGIEAILDRDDLPAISEQGRALVECEYGFDAACERYRSLLKSISERH